ncbi:hypothetical protein Niako_4987 [Niastella koreensis GR20-10]|uniref:Uncharacterized protein n=1 Tax=Niastella koreensis (strain DSM 17620 / KACC 11465 / NBRC 106392 / GR20-10) TaxID=700598 RepID=G8T8P7_NIAKG|nr:hypothetical protein [Niastella koreensis]AEW01227.1 hypothetical protein Niako_4987 [Niastella koreensis GR20-10]
MSHLSDNTTLTNNRSSVVEYSSYDNTYHLRSFLLRRNREPNAFQLVQQEMFSKAAEFSLCLVFRHCCYLVTERSAKRLT